MKKIVLMSALLAAAMAQAKPVTVERAGEVAMRYFADVVDVTPAGWSEVYLFAAAGGGGFVLVSADDCARPVLAYSYVGVFDPSALPPHVAAWVDGYRAEIASLRKNGAEASEEVRAMWGEPKPPAKASGVSPLVATQWNQSPYYNARCPYGPGSRSRVVTGCVATAMAQVMKYWNHPSVGHGSHTYIHGSLGELHVDFDTAYQWSRMPNKLNRQSSSNAVAAVAQLMYHAGVAVSMSYGVNSSGAQVLARNSVNGASAETALKTYFRYSPLLRGVAKMNYSDSAWDALMSEELHHHRPVLYTGFDATGGHAFVVDGYQLQGRRPYFHVNWGWGGAYDGYYTLDSLSPGGGGTGGNATYTFNINNAALVGIQPSTTSEGAEVSVVTVAAHDPATGVVSGSGRYSSYLDTVRVEATAAEGYRFDHWQSGVRGNPLLFIPNGDFSDTAVFVAIGKDTVGYSPDELQSAWSRSGQTEWGIRIPAERRNAYRSLRAVQFFIYAGGDYTLSIRQGVDMASAKLVHRQTFFRKSLMDWVTIELDTAVYVDNYSPLWVTLAYSSGGTAAAWAVYGGTPDGSWCRMPGGWQVHSENGRSYSWMMRAVFAERAERQFNVGLRTAMWDHSSPDVACCTATGAGVYPEDSTVTLEAEPGSGMKFLYWVGNRGDTVRENPYRYRPVADAEYTAVFAPEGLGVRQVDAEGIEVRVEGLTVRVSTEGGVPAALYDVSGRRLAATRGERALEVSVPAAGVYIVSAGGVARKVVVKGR